MRQLLLTATLLLSLTSCTYADMTPLAEMPAGEYKLDPHHASLTWSVSHQGLSNYTARFTKIDATLTLDPKDLTKSKLVATVQPGSVKTDYPASEKKDFDKELADSQWFNVAKFPEAKFESTKIVKTGKDTGKIEGNLTFMGVSKPLTLDVKFNGAYEKQPMYDQPALGFSATATIKRSDWGLKTYVPIIGDDVTLRIEAEFQMAKKS